MVLLRTLGLCLTELFAAAFLDHNHTPPFSIAGNTQDRFTMWMKTYPLVPMCPAARPGGFLHCREFRLKHRM